MIERRRHLVLALLGALLWVFCGPISPATAQSRLEKRLETHVTHLAAPELEGRGNATEGLGKARDYIVEQMEEIGLEPAGTDGFLSPFEAVTHVRLSRDVALQMGDHVLAEGVEFTPASFSDGGDFETEAVFVGYGLSAPKMGYDDYRGVDVRGKTVVALTGGPLDHESTLRDSGSGYLLSSSSKAAVALSHGARAIILVNDPRGHGERTAQRADALPPLRPALALEGIAVAHLSARAAERVFEQVDLDLAALQHQIDTSNEPASRPLELDVAGDLSLERQESTISNIVATLPGTSEAAGPALVVTAHYDGLGFGHAGSLDRDREMLHPGADDNASGVAVMLEVARALVKNPPSGRRRIIFAAPAGEELGLRGSRRLARQLFERDVGGTVVNMDMVGRLRENRVRVAHDANHSGLGVVVERASRRAKLSAEAERLEDRFTDHVSFVELGFRGLNLTTGRHGDYHVPGDTLDKLNLSGMARVALFLEHVLRDLS